MKITWIGHSCFRIEEKGFAVVIDPYEDGSVPGLGPVREEADLLLCTHDHFDHNAAGCVELRKGAENPFTVTQIDTFHDDRQGALRGTNKIFLLNDGVRKIVHFGDLGCALTPEQKEAVSGADLVMVPVGGYYTIDAVQAAEMIREIQPGLVIPMHYRSAGFGSDEIGTVEDFAAAFSSVLTPAGSSVELEELPGKPDCTVVILHPQAALS